MPISAYIDYIDETKDPRDPETLASIKEHLKKEQLLNEKILADLQKNGSDEYTETYTLFPLGLIQCPVRIPMWMFRKYPKEHDDFNLTDIEKVALSCVIHFTDPHILTGYLACSGNIENICKVSVAEADATLDKLVHKGMIIGRPVKPEFCKGHSRNMGYVINAPYLHSVLNCYAMDIWS